MSTEQALVSALPSAKVDVTKADSSRSPWHVIYRVSWGHHSSSAGAVFRNAEQFNNERDALDRYLELRDSGGGFPNAIEVRLEKGEIEWTQRLP